MTLLGKLVQAQLLLKRFYEDVEETAPKLFQSLIAECKSLYLLYDSAISAAAIIEDNLMIAQQIAILENIIGMLIDYHIDDSSNEIAQILELDYEQTSLIQECFEALKIIAIPNNKGV